MSEESIADGAPGTRRAIASLTVGVLSHVRLHRLLYYDFKEGSGSTPEDGQEVVFHYTGYNESGTLIDSSYRQGRPAQTRLGIAGMIPGAADVGVRLRLRRLRRCWLLRSSCFACGLAPAHRL